MNNPRLCDNCGKPVVEDEAHTGHEERCPNFGHSQEYDCDCDVIFCEECCPECNSLSEVDYIADEQIALADEFMEALRD